jgi:hypothetical protein
LLEGFASQGDQPPDAALPQAGNSEAILRSPFVLRDP